MRKNPKPDLSEKSLKEDWFPYLEKYTFQKDNELIETDYHPFIDTFGNYIELDKLENVIRKEINRKELLEKFGIKFKEIYSLIQRLKEKTNENSISMKEFIKEIQIFHSKRKPNKSEETLKGIAYVQEFKWWPFPFFITFITILQIIQFIYTTIKLNNLGLTMKSLGPLDICSIFIYNPVKQDQAWRFFTYIFVHSGIEHFCFHVIPQFFFGFFLEMEQEGWNGKLKFAIIYIFGVFSPALVHSIKTPKGFLAGSSSGCATIVFANMTSMIINWKTDQKVKFIQTIHYPVVKIIRILMILVVVGLEMWSVFTITKYKETTFIIHSTAALTAILFGYPLLNDRSITNTKYALKIVSMILYMSLLIIAIIWKSSIGTGIDENFEYNLESLITNIQNETLCYIYK